MAGKKRKRVREKDLKGFKIFKKVRKLFQRLRPVGCQRDRAHNRRLFMDQYMLLLLLGMFNPICDSMRALLEASDLKKVQQLLDVPHVSLGSFSEAARLFDSEHLIPILEELLGELADLDHDPRLDEVRQILTAVDGSVLRAFPAMAWALWQDDEHRAAKMHLGFEILKGTPAWAHVTDANTSETQILQMHLEANRMYVADRGYADYRLFQRIIDAGSSFVIRARDNAVFEVVEERPLSQEALDQGIVRDVVVRLGGPKTRGYLRQPVRMVEVECTPHRKSSKTGRGGPQQGDTVLLVTDEMDLPPEVISLIYQHRWLVELFFRAFKHTLGCDHLLSHCQNGIELQMYAALIAYMLMQLWTGRKLNRSTYRMIQFYLTGWADEEELQNHLDRRPPLTTQS
jgi:hypothetical protein